MALEIDSTIVILPENEPPHCFFLAVSSIQRKSLDFKLTHYPEFQEGRDCILLSVAGIL